MREILYGRHAVEEALRAGRRQVFKVVLAQGGKPTVQATFRLAARERGIPVEMVPRQQLDRISGGVHHQGVAAEAAPYHYHDLDDISGIPAAGPPPVLLLLDCLQDPQNFGALLRTGEAVAVSGVVLPKRRSVGVTPAVVNASAGAVEHLRVAQVTNMARAMEALKTKGFWIVGLEDDAQARPYDQVDLDVPLALVVGSEGQGLGRLVKRTCDFLVRLPMRGRISSLNASIAGSIVLYEALRQRERGRPVADRPSAGADGG